MVGLGGKTRRIAPILDDMAQIFGAGIRIYDESDARGIQKALCRYGACLVMTPAQDVKVLAAGAGTTQEHAAVMVLEKTLKVSLGAERLGGAKPINCLEAWLMHLVYKKKYSQMERKAVYQTAEDYDRSIQEEEMVLRQEIVHAGRRLIEENLVQGTWGNLSAQLDERHMLVTPSGMDYDKLTPYDIVRVNLFSLEHEGSLKPTSEKLIHAEMLKKKTNTRWVIHSHPVNCSAFAAARQAPVIADKASEELLGGSVALARYALPGTKRLARNVIKAMRESNACIMENHGMLVCGSTADETFDRCATLEHLAGKGQGD
ncbi:MAG: class II aldolase/adducin family protein [Coriobacteriia bacterium]|nr:class II aldolase/adducin family protein [Coriobacteriia bacterium]